MSGLGTGLAGGLPPSSTECWARHAMHAALIRPTLRTRWKDKKVYALFGVDVHPCAGPGYESPERAVSDRKHLPCAVLDHT